MADRVFWAGFVACFLAIGLLYIWVAILSIEEKSKRYASSAAFHFACGMVCAFVGLVTTLPWLKIVCIFVAGWNFVWGAVYMWLYYKEKGRKIASQKADQGAEHFDRYA